MRSSGDDAAAVAGVESAALGKGDGAGVAAEVEDGAVGAEEGFLEDGVAGEAVQEAGADGSEVFAGGSARR